MTDSLIPKKLFPKFENETEKKNFMKWLKENNPSLYVIGEKLGVFEND